MKKAFMIIAVVLGLAATASAQHGYRGGHTRVVVVSPRIGFGYSPFYYSPFGYAGFGYSPFGYPYGYNGYRGVSKLDVQMADIKADYRDKIKSARHDGSLDRTERKKIIRGLKSERDKALHDARVNYYKPRKTSREPATTG